MCVHVSVHVRLCVYPWDRLGDRTPSSGHASSPLMSDGKWCGQSLNCACRINSHAHTSDPVNQTIRVREKENKGEEKKVGTERNTKKQVRRG